MDSMKNNEIEQIIEDITENDDDNLNNLLLKLVEKIIIFEDEKVTTIAELLNYNPEEDFIEPLTQGKVYNFVMEVCKKYNIDIEEINDSFGGLAYYYKFKKTNKKDNDKETLIKELSEAYRSNNQKLIYELQDKIQKLTEEELYQKFNNKNNILKMNKPKYINRENLLNKLGYLYEHMDKRKKYPSMKEFMIDEIQTIKNELLNNEGIDKKYIPCVRAKHCINEFIYYMEREQLEDALYDIYEVIESDKKELYDNHFNKDYEYSMYISKEEKSILLSMINRFEAKLHNALNIYSTVELFKQASNMLYQYNGINYGGNKFLSLPVPVSYNKLKSIILYSDVSDNSIIYNCGDVLIDTITGKIDYNFETEKPFSNSNSSILKDIELAKIEINSKEEYENIKNKYFKLLDDLILIYASKKDSIRTEKMIDFINIYKNIELEQVQIFNTQNNEFMTWCINLAFRNDLSVNYDFKKVEHEKTNYYNVKATTIGVPNVDKNENSEYNEEIANDIVKKICKEIRDLPAEKEFTIRQLLTPYHDEFVFGKVDIVYVTEKIFTICKENNILFVEKNPDADYGFPWNIPRIKKDSKKEKNSEESNEKN